MTTTAYLNKELATAFFHGFTGYVLARQLLLPAKGESCPKDDGAAFLLWSLEFSVRMLVGN
ncbi:hypothetical protein DV714_10485 [Parageobacillus thermoglucosidasius]|nr:hypothetical protein DV714_10485 [Parageobacillus thermoglucosidasius]